ncbi:MAG: 6-carboxytetrahydropterin synthase QueD [Candidatus Omnitrophota bacterium]|nr:6-carboxytetrahydropterin synthase QueD [Candidatus Omnitrophota bacterium]
MFELNIKKEFSAAHRLREYQGQCEALHGHNWEVEVLVAAGKLNKIGMAADFKDIKNCLNEILEDLDHSYLNELPYFEKHNPTSENIAKYIFDKLKPEVAKLKVKLTKVTVWESDNANASYTR